MEDTACCVVGGGPAGMMLGLLLARGGIEVTVLEKHGDFLRDFRGDTVHPSTLRLLDELGLGGRFAELPARRLTEMRMEIDGTVVVMADFGRLRGPHRYIALVPQWDFLDLLAGAAAEEPAFTLRMRHAVTGLLRDAHGRVRGVRGVGPDGEFELGARLVVACDGRDSAVREAVGLRQKSCEVPMDVWQVKVPRPASAGSNGAGDVKGGRVFARFGGGQAAVTMDRGDYFQTSYLIPKGADTALRARDVAWLRGRLGELFGWDEQVTAAIRGWEDVKLLEVTMGRLPRWYADGLLCIGDAAHSMSPVGGMGVNLAVQDAVAAARRLVGPLAARTAGGAGSAVSARVLQAVQRRRTLPTVLAQRAQLTEHENLLKPALAGTLRGDRLPQPLRAVQAFPALGGVTAYLGGVGLRPEHAPEWARPGGEKVRP